MPDSIDHREHYGVQDRAEMAPATSDPVAVEAQRGEAAYERLCELIVGLDYMLVYNIKRAAVEYGMAREKHAIEVMAQIWRKAL
jgi:hypothetical protein